MAAMILVASYGSQACAQAEEKSSLDTQCDARSTGLMQDVKCYVTAPAHWDRKDWAWFGGTLVAIGAAHHYDSDVRNHFVEENGTTVAKSSDLEDAIPALAVFTGTWVFANLKHDSQGQDEAYAMLESAGFSVTTSYLLKFAAGRERPDVTSDPNDWRSGGDSFPSMHASAAFAIGTVLAESGGEKYRWVRRVLGYGMAGYTGYARLKHNAHWLSDTVAGAGLGISTAHFVMNRQYSHASSGQVMVVPLEHGVMLTYNAVLN
jgi:hypothetical protein